MIARFRSFLQRLRQLPFIRDLADYFDEEERRLVVRAAVVGVVVWAVAFVLKTAVYELFALTLQALEAAPSYLFVLLPLIVGALIATYLSKKRATTLHYHDRDGHIRELIDVEGDGLERAITLYYSSEPSLENTLQGQEGLAVRWELPTFSLAARKFAATLVTLGSGGSGGLTAGVTLIGESMAAGLFKPRRTVDKAGEQFGFLRQLFGWWSAGSPEELQTAQLSGIAAAVATLLGAPFTAAFFATEVMYRRRPLIEKLVYSLIAALIAYFLSSIFSGGHADMFEVETLYVPPTSDWRYLSVVVLMSVIIILVSIYFTRVRVWVDYLFHHYLSNIWYRHLLGAIITGLIAIGVALTVDYFGMGDYGLILVLGPGQAAIDAALAGELTMAVALLALLAKIPATLATISSGGSAGLLISSIFFGTMIATAMADYFNYEPMVLIIPAMTASLVAMVNVPLAAILFVIELFGASYMLPALIVLVITTILAHNNTLYRTQRDSFDKNEIMPGVSVRRVLIPPDWAGKTLLELDLRKRFDLNVIGFVEIHDEDGLPHTRLGATATNRLAAGDVLVVLGADENLNALETAVAKQGNQETPQNNTD